MALSLTFYLMTLKLKARRDQLGDKRREKNNRLGASGKTKRRKNEIDNDIKQNSNMQSVFQRMEKTVEISWQNRGR